MDPERFKFCLRVLTGEVGLMRTMIAKMLRPVFESLGLLSPPGDESPPAGPGSPTCEDRLKHMKGLGFDAKVIYDCGAFIGRWALDVSAIYTQSELVLVEPNPQVHEQIIANTSSIKERVRVVAAAVSDHEGVGILNVWDNPRHKNPVIALAASSLLPHVQGKPSKEEAVRVTTIDTIVEETGKQPDLLKLDLQGGEHKALLGAGKTLGRAELCIVEFGCLQAYVARTTPRDLMDLMYDHGFCLYDIVDLIYRPYDGALAGGDFFFIKRDGRLREHKDYF
jgi:FkbM family methyltransferase